ncbi:hypothetical protein HY214_01725 [Candidatus Roizmanbacteria bacterium]|nr:hypothetical protein [Candidatus Roizmanbacteria bacterium]
MSKLERQIEAAVDRQMADVTSLVNHWILQFAINKGISVADWMRMRLEAQSNAQGSGNLPASREMARVASQRRLSKTG